MNTQSEPLENWNELRSAYHVARLQTLSAAADYIGVHHSTIIRHIDNLEERLGCKLFLRHPRGYVPTEAGQDLLQVAASVDDQFTQLAGRLKGRAATVSGELVITTLSELSPQLTPLLVKFREIHPDIRVKLVADERVLKLEYGEAHIAIRAGSKPNDPDNVVQTLNEMTVGLFAHKDYVKKRGMLNETADIDEHDFVIMENRRVGGPFNRWMQENVPPENIVYRATQMRSVFDAIHAGAGMGFLMDKTGDSNPDLVRMNLTTPNWDTILWIVTHVDLHRTAKVQAFLAFLKENREVFE